jgi:hypothetical protein
VQAAELQHDEEPSQEFRAAGIQQVLPGVPEAHAAQREQVDIDGLTDWQIDELTDELPPICQSVNPSISQFV